MLKKRKMQFFEKNCNFLALKKGTKTNAKCQMSKARENSEYIESRSNPSVSEF